MNKKIPPLDSKPRKTLGLLRGKHLTGQAPLDKRHLTGQAKFVIPFAIRLISFSFVLFVLLMGFGESARAQGSLDTPTITATAKGPNQINLQWSAVTNPGYGYKIEIQSDSDSRYLTWTELSFGNGKDYLPYWVTESQYTDPQDESACQYPVFSIKPSTIYNFRVRSYSSPSQYSEYSNTVSATTLDYIVRHVSLSGNDGNDGTSEGSAWRHIYYAGQQATAGTVVIVHGGNYANDYLRPSNSGSNPNNKIVFMAVPWETVTITSHGGESWDANIYLTSTSYVVVDGIDTIAEVNNANEATVNVASNAHHNALVNMEVSNVGWIWVCLGHHNLFQGNYIHDSGSNASPEPWGNSPGLTLHGSSADRNTVQYSTIRRCEHDTGLLVNGADYNKWLNNLHDGGWGLGIEMVSGAVASCDYNLFEGSVIADVVADAITTGVYKPGFEISGNFNTLRRNVIRNGGSSGTERSHAIELSRMHGYRGTNNLIYNNVLYGNDGHGIIAFGPNQQDNTFANNIVYANAGPITVPCDDCQIHLAENYGGATIHHSLILYASGGVEYPNQPTISEQYSDCKTAGDADSDWAEFSDNYAFSPGFVDESNHDFHLNTTSNCTDAGAVVNDPTWGNISYTGSAPDLGAFEYFSAGSDLTPPSRSNPQPTGTLISGTTSTTISLDTDETAVCKYSVIANTNYDDMSNVFAMTDSTDHSTDVTDLADGNSYTYYVRCEDESGNQNTDDFEISFSVASSTTYSISNFINLVSDWLKSESGLESDVNGDGVVNTRDLGIMMSNWQ